jgi:hypothetical protein
MPWQRANKDQVARPDTPELLVAAAAVQEAEEALDAARADSLHVELVGRSLREMRERNHFEARIRQALIGGMR